MMERIWIIKDEYGIYSRSNFKTKAEALKNNICYPEYYYDYILISVLNEVEYSKMKLKKERCIVKLNDGSYTSIWKINNIDYFENFDRLSYAINYFKK